jgi:hypothetical protein
MQRQRFPRLPLFLDHVHGRPITQRRPLVRLCSEAFRNGGQRGKRILRAGYRNANQTRPIPKATAPPPASISIALCGPENNPVPCPNQKSPTAINSGPTKEAANEAGPGEGWPGPLTSPEQRPSLWGPLGECSTDDKRTSRKQPISVANDPGCAKTCMCRECAELFSPVSSVNGDWQSCPFPIQRNRDRISTRKIDVRMMKRSSVNFGSR